MSNPPHVCDFCQLAQHYSIRSVYQEKDGQSSLSIPVKRPASARYICNNCIAIFYPPSEIDQQQVEQLLKNTEDQIKTVIKEQKTTK
jgi:hypothetical protein